MRDQHSVPCHLLPACTRRQPATKAALPLLPLPARPAPLPRRTRVHSPPFPRFGAPGGPPRQPPHSPVTRMDSSIVLPGRRGRRPRGRRAASSLGPGPQWPGRCGRVISATRGGTRLERTRTPDTRCEQRSSHPQGLEGAHRGSTAVAGLRTGRRDVAAPPVARKRSAPTQSVSLH